MRTKCRWWQRHCWHMAADAVYMYKTCPEGRKYNTKARIYVSTCCICGKAKEIVGGY